jgi:hypothetical protein
VDQSGPLAGDPIAEALEAAARLPAAAVAGVFARYGKPLAIEVPPPGDGETVVNVDGATVRALRFRMPVDVIGNDWFVMERAGEEAVAIPGPLFAAAIAALARRF